MKGAKFAETRVSHKSLGGKYAWVRLIKRTRGRYEVRWNPGTIDHLAAGSDVFADRLKRTGLWWIARDVYEFNRHSHSRTSRSIFSHRWGSATGLNLDTALWLRDVVVGHFLAAVAEPFPSEHVSIFDP